MLKDHRITINSKPVGAPWYDNRRNEWREYTCGVKGHNCNKTIKVKTGNKLPRR